MIDKTAAATLADVNATKANVRALQDGMNTAVAGLRKAQAAAKALQNDENPLPGINEHAFLLQLNLMLLSAGAGFVESKATSMLVASCGEQYAAALAAQEEAAASPA